MGYPETYDVSAFGDRPAGNTTVEAERKARADALQKAKTILVPTGAAYVPSADIVAVAEWIITGVWPMPRPDFKQTHDNDDR